MSEVSVLTVAPLSRVLGDGAERARPLVAGIERWRTDVVESLTGRLRGPLDWHENPSFEPETWAIGRAWPALRLLAVYAERTDLELPDHMPESLALDPAWNAAERGAFQKSKYGQLVVGECWLPADFDFTFRGPRPDGRPMTFGSLAALRDQLHFLDARTFSSTAAARELWAAETVPDDAPFVRVARQGLAMARAAVERAHQIRLPLTCAPA